jgi:microcystin degradation protein MlrC
VLSASAQPAGTASPAMPSIASHGADRRGGEASHAIDGILLGLHGAMVTEFRRGRRRRAAGAAARGGGARHADRDHARSPCQRHAEDVPLANIIVSYKTYPHIDMREVGRAGGRDPARAHEGRDRAETLRAHRPMLDEVNGGRTDVGPMVERSAECRRL